MAIVRNLSGNRALNAPDIDPHIPQPQDAAGVSAPSTPYSGTITTHGVFQTILPANGTRLGGSFFNNSTDEMYVFFGPAAQAIQAKSIGLPPGGGVTFNSGNVVLADEISATSATIDGAPYMGFWQ